MTACAPAWTQSYDCAVDISSPSASTACGSSTASFSAPVPTIAGGSIRVSSLWGIQAQPANGTADVFPNTLTVDGLSGPLAHQRPEH